MNDPSLQALRAQGLHHHDPVRFHYLEVLARQLPCQPAVVQQVLRPRWTAAMEDYAARARRAGAGASRSKEAVSESPLALLNRSLQTRTAADAAPGPGEGTGQLPDLQSVRRFAQVWSKIAAEQQLAQALVRGPENAGPLNSHKLVLRALRLMRRLSPDYTRHFLAQMDALLWLDQVRPGAALPTAKSVRKTRRKG